jgi:hypothetical protein
VFFIPSFLNLESKKAARKNTRDYLPALIIFLMIFLVFSSIFLAGFLFYESTQNRVKALRGTASMLASTISDTSDPRAGTEYWVLAGLENSRRLNTFLALARTFSEVAIVNVSIGNKKGVYIPQGEQELAGDLGHRFLGEFEVGKDLLHVVQLFQSLDPDLQKIVVEAGREASDYGWKEMGKMNAELLEKLKGLGMSVTAVDRQEVQNAIKPVWNTWMDRVGPEGNFKDIVAEGRRRGQIRDDVVPVGRDVGMPKRETDVLTHFVFGFV